MQSVDNETDSAWRSDEPSGNERSPDLETEIIRAITGKPVTLGGQRISAGRVCRVVGDRMHGSACHVNQGDLSGEGLVFIASE
jgi:hypothetical protein